MFLDGSTGAGKSRSLLIPTIDLLTYGADDGESRPQTIIVSDVKSELIELTGDELERRGYRVLLLDAQHPEKSDTFNPLEMVDRLANGGNLPGAEQAADAVARTLIAGEGDAKASHWTESARRCSPRRSFWSCWTRAARGAASTSRRSTTSCAWGRRGPARIRVSR